MSSTMNIVQRYCCKKSLLSWSLISLQFMQVGGVNVDFIN
jgi:hypothetical protein